MGANKGEFAIIKLGIQEGLPVERVDVDGAALPGNGSGS
jgi:hypothetical protein